MYIWAYSPDFLQIKSHRIFVLMGSKMKHIIALLSLLKLGIITAIFGVTCIVLLGAEFTVNWMFFTSVAALLMILEIISLVVSK